MPGGATHALPRYYRDKLFSDDAKEYMNSQLSDKFDAAFQAGVKQHGSVHDYYRVLHDQIRQKNQLFNSTSKRNKL